MKYLRTKNLLLIPFTLLLLSLLTANVSAASIATDFSVLEGTILFQIQNEYMLDLDSSNGLQIGDILSVTEEGEHIFDATHTKIIGTRDTTSGYLQVTKIEGGYSYAKAINSDFYPEKGMTVKRFDQVPVALAADIPKSLATLLKTQLPQLSWGAENPAMTFSIENQQLLVTDQQQATLKSYSLNPTTGLITGQNNAQQTLPTTSEKVSPSLIDNTLDGLFGMIGLNSDFKDERLDAPVAFHSKPKIGDIKLFIPSAEKLIAVTVADLDQDQNQELFVATSGRIGIFRIGTTGIELTDTIYLPTGAKVLGLDSGDIDNDGRPELYINAATGSKLSSQVVEFKQNAYTATLTNSDRFFRVVEIDNKPTLFGQKTGDSSIPFNAPLEQLSFNNGELSPIETLQLASDATIFSLVPIQENPVQNYAYISNSNSLVVRNGQGKQLWKSSESYGAPLTGAQLSALYIQPKAQRLPSGELVFGHNLNDQTQQQGDEHKSYITALSWANNKLNQQWQTDELNGVLTDLVVADVDNDGFPDLVTLIQIPDKTSGEIAQSGILFYQLN